MPQSPTNLHDPRLIRTKATDSWRVSLFRERNGNVYSVVIRHFNAFAGYISGHTFNDIDGKANAHSRFVSSVEAQETECKTT